MVPQCLEWIPALWNELVNSVANKDTLTDRPLPDEVTFEILRRLPPMSVMNCRMVCKQWLSITSSPSFVNMYRESAPSTLLLVQNNSWRRPKPDELALLIFDEDAKQFKKMRRGWITVEKEKYAGILIGCCKNKLVFMLEFVTERYYLCDLLAREKVIVEPPRPSTFSGIFFHPVAREFRLLFHCKVAKCSHPDQYDIFIYGCQSKTWRVLKNIFPYRVHVVPKPIELNGNLHWLARTMNNIVPCRNSIIMFDTDTEKFSSMPHPGSACDSWREHKSMYLLEMERSLSFGKVFQNFICIWVLEDYQNWSWTLRYKVDFNWWNVKGFPFKNETIYSSSSSADNIELWNIKNGELMMSWFYRGLFRYHLERDTLTKLDFPEDESCDGFLVSLAWPH